MFRYRTYIMFIIMESSTSCINTGSKIILFSTQILEVPDISFIVEDTVVLCICVQNIFFPFFLLQKFNINFLSQLCKYLQGPAEDDCLIIRPSYANIYIYITIHNVFVIYDESKAVPEIPSHDKVPQNHAAD